MAVHRVLMLVLCQNCLYSILLKTHVPKLTHLLYLISFLETSPETTIKKLFLIKIKRLLERRKLLKKKTLRAADIILCCHKDLISKLLLFLSLLQSFFVVQVLLWFSLPRLEYLEWSFRAIYQSNKTLVGGSSKTIGVQWWQ